MCNMAIRAHFHDALSHTVIDGVNYGSDGSLMCVHTSCPAVCVLHLEAAACLPRKQRGIALHWVCPCPGRAADPSSDSC